MAANPNPTLELVGTLVPKVPSKKSALPDSPEPIFITGRGKSFIRHTDEEIERALRDAHGYSSVAARVLGITLRGLNKRVASNAKLQEVLHEVREGELDETEGQLKKLIMSGALGAIIWKLKCHGRHRGWVERDDFNSPVNDTVLQPPTIIINFVSPRKKENEPVSAPTRLED
jgi:hypothetical protein